MTQNQEARTFSRRQFLNDGARLFAGAVLLGSGCSGAETEPVADSSTAQPTQFEDENGMIYGVTLDRINDLDSSIEAIEYLSERIGRPTVRMVFDEYMEPDIYRDTVGRLSEVSDVMGEILDSAYVKLYPLEEYAERTRRYVNAFSDQVSIWEIGNEANGAWLLADGEGPGTVAQKVTAAHEIVKDAGGKTAITLYNNQECYADDRNRIWNWTDNYLPDEVRAQTDFALISYYEEDCEDVVPEWDVVFRKLKERFPLSDVGFGEVGTTRQAEKIDYLKRYYQTRPDVADFVGGYFWWYFYTDMVEQYQQGNTEMLDAIVESAQS